MGAAEYSPTLFIKLAQLYNLPTDIAKHLADNYGDQGSWVVQVASLELTLVFVASHE